MIPHTNNIMQVHQVPDKQLNKHLNNNSTSMIVCHTF